MAGAGKTAGRKIDGLKIRMYNGKKVTPVLYSGHSVGQGKYMAGEVDGVLVVDTNGRPLPLREIGTLE